MASDESKTPQQHANCCLSMDFQVTIQTIRNAISSSTSPIDVFRIINYSNPRCWRAVITFDEKGRNHLALTATPHLSGHNLKKILDGTCPILYAFDELRINFGAKYYAISSRELASLPATAVGCELHEIPPPETPFDIALVGYSDLRSIQRFDSFRTWVKSATWLGSAPTFARNAKLEIVLLSDRHTISPSINLPEAFHSAPRYQKALPLYSGDDHIGEVEFLVAYGKERIFRHRVFGEFSPTKVQADFWKCLSRLRYLAVYLQVDSNLVSWATDAGPPHLRELYTLFDAITDSWQRVRQSEEFLTFLERLKEAEFQRQAELLEARQQKLSRSEKVRVHDEVLFKVPTSENEVVSLYMKLEGMRCLPFECRVLEYTSREGIDALGDFRFSNTEAFFRFAPIEFEHILENYFDHAHPPGQTKLIICWDSADDVIAGEVVGPHSCPWLRYIETSSAHRIPVVLLRRIPGLVVDHEHTSHT